VYRGLSEELNIPSEQLSEVQRLLEPHLNRFGTLLVLSMWFWLTGVLLVDRVAGAWGQGLRVQRNVGGDIQWRWC